MPPLDRFRSETDLNKTKDGFSQAMELNSDTQDLPPESFKLPKNQELDWLNRNAILDRNASTKMISSAANFHSSSTLRRSFHGSPSQRPSLNTKTNSSSIIGFPRSHHYCFADGNLRRSFKPGNGRLFRSRSEPIGKSVVLVSEPGSPKVSCTGRVRCKKRREKRTGLWAGLRAFFERGLEGRGR